MFSRGFREDCGQDTSEWDVPQKREQLLTPIPLDKSCYYVVIPKGKPGMVEQLREQWKVMIQNSKEKPVLVAMPDDLALHEMTLSQLRKVAKGVNELLAQREKETGTVPTTGHYDKVSPTELIKRELPQV